MRHGREVMAESMVKGAETVYTKARVFRCYRTILRNDGGLNQRVKPALNGR